MLSDKTIPKCQGNLTLAVAQLANPNTDISCAVNSLKCYKRDCSGSGSIVLYVNYLEHVNFNRTCVNEGKMVTRFLQTMAEKLSLLVILLFQQERARHGRRWQRAYRLF